MSYGSTIEARLARKVTRAITEYDLIGDGDRVMVGLSGGKDSWALMQILDVLRKRAPIGFSLVAVTVDSGYADFRHDAISRACAERGWGDLRGLVRESTMALARSGADLLISYWANRYGEIFG